LLDSDKTVITLRNKQILNPTNTSIKDILLVRKAEIILQK